MWWVLVCMRGCDSFTFGLTYTAGPLSRTASQTVVVVASATPLTASLTSVVVNAEGEASTGKQLIRRLCRAPTRAPFPRCNL